ncbi:hypothetical protein ALQ61_200089 [Pseudomonas coronafaciens pv. zizaniae]|nr:hypothetical protein ALQ61_200089 [Pseudomonas coronafaciens pv. zizaniae]
MQIRNTYLSSVIRLEQNTSNTSPKLEAPHNPLSLNERRIGIFTGEQKLCVPGL